MEPSDATEVKSIPAQGRQGVPPETMRILFVHTGGKASANRWHQAIASAAPAHISVQCFPIEIPGGEHVVINSSTAPIIYNKGGSILRQVQGYIGPDNFQKGLRHYLQTHAYGCAASQYLWEAFEAAADMPVTALMENWVGQPGFPLVTVARREAGGEGFVGFVFRFADHVLRPPFEPVLADNNRTFLTFRDIIWQC